nr:PREDICTED: uncharacterized protein LOC109033080 isoform X2 [Bemisia tabaci]
MALEFFKIFCLASIVLIVSADLEHVGHLENAARLAFEKHYPTFVFEKIIHSKVNQDKNLAYFTVSSSKSEASDSSSSFLCSLELKLDHLDHPVAVPQVVSSKCDVSSSGKARQAGTVRDIHSVYNVTEEEMGLVNELADFAAKKLDEIDADNKKNIIDKVLNPTKQFAGGILYEFTLKLIESNCPEQEEDYEACKRSSFDPVKLCNIKVLRTWALKKVPHATLVESHCQPEYETLYGNERKPKLLDHPEEENSSARHSKKPLLGAPLDVDVNDEKVVRYAEEALAALGVRHDPYKFGLIRLLNAKVHPSLEGMVHGLYYFLKLEVGVSKCLKDSPKVKCYEQTVKTNICNIQIWLQEGSNSVNLRDASCQEDLLKSRKRRSENSMVGGWSAQSVDDSDVKRYAKLSLPTLEALPGSKGKLKLVEVISVHTQVVSGVLYSLELKVANSKADAKICKVKVWVQPWLNKEEVTDASCENEASTKKKVFSSGTPDGLKSVDVNNSDVQKYAQLSLSSLMSLAGSDLKLVKVVNAQQQVVSGMLYHLNLEITNSNGESKLCKTKVWVKPKKEEVTDASCEDKPSSRRKRSRSDDDSEDGDTVRLTPKNPLDPEVQKSAKYSLSSLQKLSDFKDNLTLVEVMEAFAENVSGVIYHLKLKVADSREDPKICKVKVHKYWSGSQEVSGAICLHETTEKDQHEHEHEHEHKRKRRSIGIRKRPILGGLIPVDTSDPTIQILAKLSLSSVERLTGTSDSLQLNEVTEAYKQVVAGLLYHITLEVSNSKGESKTCKVKVLEQPWISKEPKVTDAYCQDKPLHSGEQLSNNQTPELPNILTSLDSSEAKVQTLAKFSVSYLERTSKTNEELQLIDVIEAYKQEDSGVLYHLKLSVSNKEGVIKTCKVKVLEQPWISDEPSVTDARCEVKPLTRRKRPSQNWAGIVSPVNVNDEAVQHYARFALSTLANLPESGDDVRLVEILKAHRQVVAGWLYTLKLRIADSKTDSRICDVKVWVQHSVTDDIKEVDASCEDKPSRRSKRFIGGIKELKPDHDDALKYAMFSVPFLGPSFGSEERLKLIEVVKAYSQEVVSGKLYHLKLKVGSSTEDSKICTTKVWVRPWLHPTEQLTDAMCENKLELQKKENKRSVGSIKSLSKNTEDLLKAAENIPQKKLKGVNALESYKQHLESNLPTNLQRTYREEVNTDNEKVQEIARFSLRTLEKLSESNEPLELLEVIKAWKQLADGLIYDLQLRVGNSTGIQICNAKVLVPKLSKDAKVMKALCENISCPARDKRSQNMLVCGRVAVDKDEPKIQKYAQNSVASLQDLIGAPYQLSEVIDARIEVDQGLLYLLTLELTPIKCAQIDCSLDAKICYVKLLVKESVKSEKITDAACKDKDAPKFRRSINYITDPSHTPMDKHQVIHQNRVQEVANFAVTSIATLTSENKLVLQKILEAHVLMVSGQLYRLKLEIGKLNPNSNCSQPPNETECGEVTEPKICDVEVWVQDWIHSSRLMDAHCNGTALIDREKRSLGMLVGGKEQTNVDVEKVQNYALASLAKLDSLSQSEYKTGLHKVVDAHVQRSKRGNNEQAPDEIIGETKPNNSDIPQKSIDDTFLWKHQRKSTKSFIQIGLSTTENPQVFLEDDEETCQYLNLTMRTLDDLTPSPFKLGLIKLVDLRKQIRPRNVSISLKLIVGYTKCPKSEDDSTPPLACAAEVFEPRKCQVKLTILPENEKINVQSAECDGIPDKIFNRKKRLIVNGQDVKSVSSKKKSEDLLPKLAHHFKFGSKLHLNRTIVARVERVNGLLYTYILEITADEPCILGPNGVTGLCTDEKDVTHKMVHRYCLVRVLEKEWLAHTEVTFSKCGASLKKLQKANVDHVDEFLDFAKKYDKKYTDEEFSRRLHIFRANLKKISYLQETEQGTATYGITEFADLSAAEFKAKMGLQVPQNYLPRDFIKQAEIPKIELPTEFDWRDKNAVTPVKNQGMCGSCWAFSVTGNVEGQNAIKNGKLISLSEQELVDCDKTDNGCGGGYMYDAYQAIEKLGGLEAEDEYPYEGKNDQCRFKRSAVRVEVKAAVNISSDETEMAQWLVQNGPISIGINANAMQFYLGGVSHPLKFLCSPSQLDHGVLIVGFGVHNYPLFNKTLPYWTVKNSWGNRWGVKGYYLVYRGDGTCGVNLMASSAVL